MIGCVLDKCFRSSSGVSKDRLLSPKKPSACETLRLGHGQEAAVLRVLVWHVQVTTLVVRPNELCFKRLISRHQTRQRLRRVLRFAYARAVLLTRNKPAYADLTLDIFSTGPQPQLTRSNFYLQEPQRF